MKHKRRHRTIKRLQKKYRYLAAAVASAALLAGVSVPGVPAAVVHAAPSPSTGSPPAITQLIGDTNMHALRTTESGAPAEYTRELSVTATAYAPGAHDNGQWGNKTYLGTRIRPGVIAVDPRVIPLGSQVYILYPDGHGEYAIAEDTGGAIKGNRIDIAMRSVKEAKQFGMKKVKVFVIKSPAKV